MKQVLLALALALVAPTLAAAYPDPNVTFAISAGELVDTVWTQPKPASLILADGSLVPSKDK